MTPTRFLVGFFILRGSLVIERRVRGAKKNGLVLSLALLAGCLGVGGCDPLIQIGGAYFPCWLFSPLVGVLLAFLCRPIFIALRVEELLWPKEWVYSAIALFGSCASYLLFFR